MLSTMDMAKGARKIVEVCAGVKAGEKVLIVTDSGIMFSITEALAANAVALGAETAVIITSPGRKPGEEPNALVTAAMQGADVILSPTTRTIFHSKATAQALAKGARLLSLTEATEKVLVSGGIEADFVALQPRVQKLKGLFEQGSKVHITAPQGTDLYLDIRGRPAQACSGLCLNPGEKIGIPELEVFIAPLETYTYGKIVIDACIAGYGRVHTPVTIDVEKGRAVAIHGEAEAEALCAMLAAAQSDNAHNIVEIGIGLNDCAHVIGEIIEDEGAYGTGHFAFGNNVYFGGQSEAPIHLDMVYFTPTIELDGMIVMRDGVLI
jgi:leucyl aminopeptidase (aminopeptidase T)